MISNRPTVINILNREGFPDSNEYLSTVSNEVWAKANMDAIRVSVDITRKIVNQLKQENTFETFRY